MNDWPVKTLGKICVDVDRQDPVESGQINFTYIDLSAVNQVMKHIDGSRTIVVDEAPGRARQLVKTGDVLVSTVRPNLNAVALVGSELDGATASTGFCVLRPNSSLIEPGLLFAWVRNQLFIDELTSLAKGASYPAVTDNIVKALKMPVPPLEEQKRIVDLLDAATARVTELTGCYEQARTNADNLFTSALRDALEGNPDWPVRTLGDLCDIYQPQTIGTKDLIADGKYIVYGANGPIGRYDRFNHEKSEVTVTCRGATCGTVNVTPPEVWITGNAMVVRPNDMEMSKEMMRYVLEGLDYSRIITGAAQPQITRQTLAPSTIQVPPLEEQKQIVARLGSMRAKTSEMVAAYDAKLTAAKNLRQSILESAFKGEL